jgi:dynein heavy chain
VYYQVPYKINDSGDIQYFNSPKEFFVTDGQKYKLSGKGCYFLRNNGDKPINKNNGTDSQVLFGEISEHSVYSLNTIINQIFKPLVD